MKVIEVPPRLKEYEPYNFSLLGASVTGYKRSCTAKLDRKLSATWRAMMLRCYDTGSKDYRFYGAKGISVCKRWHTCSAYIEDIKLLHGWKYKVKEWENYQLDKDYYSSNQYSPDTCVWLTRKENIENAGRPIRATNCFGW